MNTYAKLIACAAAVLVVAVIGYQFLPGRGTIGGQPSGQPSPAATASPIATAPPTAAATAKPLADGLNGPGVYSAKPMPATDPSVGVTLTLTEPWEFFGASLYPEAPGPQAPAGLAILFLEVTSLNPDPCHWQGTADDVDTGTTVADLVAALEAQTAYVVSDPVAVTIGGYSGQRVDIVGPTAPFASGADIGNAPGCDDGVVQLWSTREDGEAPIHLQGPANRWQANILDVAGTRVVVVAQDFPGTTTADRARLDAVLASMTFEP